MSWKDNWRDSPTRYSVTIAIIASVLLLLFSFVSNYKINTSQFLTILIIIVLGTLIAEYMFGRGSSNKNDETPSTK